MASKIDVSALDLNQEEAKQISEAVFAKEFQNGEISRDHEVETGVVWDKQIPFVGKLDDSLKAASGCAPGEAGTFALTEKKWEPKKFTTRLTHCADDLNNLLKLFRRESKVNPDFYDRIDSEEMGLITAVAAVMVREATPNKIWFNDTAADLASGAGVFTAGTDLDLHNVIDGLWKQIFAAITAGSTYHVNIQENEEAAKADQIVFDADDAFNMFVSMSETADSRLMDDPNKKFYVTRSLADNYRATLRSKSLTNGFLERAENGTVQLMFDGIPIEVRHDWDRFIRANQDDGTAYNLPHRALLTTPQNIPVGTLSEEDFEEFDSFYDKKSKTNNLDIAFSLDAKFLEDYMAVAAY